MAKIIHKLTDLTHLKWSKTRNSSGTTGSFLKAQDTINGKKVYYKLSNYDSYKGVVGHECVNEIIADRILDILRIEHLSYTLLNAKIIVDGKEIVTYLCSSDDFKEVNESKIALDTYYQMECEEDESPYEFCKRMGWERYIADMLLIDFLILNRDRHGANIEVLRNYKKKTYHLAPLFDQGLSLLFSTLTPEAIEEFDVMKNGPVQCFVGTYDARENLLFIDKKYRRNIPDLDEKKMEYIFEGIEKVVSKRLLEKMKEMVSRRWAEYENFCNQR